MATKIRLARHGAKKHPFYRIIVTDSRAPRDGRRLDQVGIYDPSQKPSRVEFQQDKLSHWLRLGAQPSATVAQLIKRRGAAPLESAPSESTEAGAGQSQPAPAPETGEAQT
jgi:small subunit ribosomal protein S16